MKVIFLDVDGVLNSDEYFDKIHNLNVNGIEAEVDVNKIKLLKKAIDKTGAEIVLCSSWRFTRNGNCLKELLAQYDIIVDSTPFLRNERGLEIKKWLVENSKIKDIEDFVILDDEVFDSYDDILLKKLIKIGNGNDRGFAEGLQEKDVNEIIHRLGEINKTIRDNMER